MLGLNPRSVIAQLFTETGLLLITYGHVEMALQYLVYVLTEKPVLPYNAMREAHTLAISGSSSWLSDLHLAV